MGSLELDNDDLEDDFATDPIRASEEERVFEELDDDDEDEEAEESVTYNWADDAAEVLSRGQSATFRSVAKKLKRQTRANRDLQNELDALKAAEKRADTVDGSMVSLGLVAMGVVPATASIPKLHELFIDYAIEHDRPADAAALRDFAVEYKLLRNV